MYRQSHGLTTGRYDYGPYDYGHLQKNTGSSAVEWKKCILCEQTLRSANLENESFEVRSTTCDLPEILPYDS